MLSLPHLIVIFVVALIVFGPQKLPELARNLGRMMAEFRRASMGLRGTLEENLRELEREADTARRPPGAAAPAAPEVSAVPAPAEPSVPGAPPVAGPDDPQKPPDDHAATA